MLGSVRQTEERESESEEGRGARKEGHRPLAGREGGRARRRAFSCFADARPLRLSIFLEAPASTLQDHSILSYS